MKRHIALIGILAGTLALTGCMPSPFETHSLSNPSLDKIEVNEEPTYSGNSLEDNEEYTHSGNSLEDLLDPQMQDVALTICKTLDIYGLVDGVTLIKNIGAGHGLSNEDATDLIAVGIYTYCPEYEEEVLRYGRGDY